MLLTEMTYLFSHNSTFILLIKSGPLKTKKALPNSILSKGFEFRAYAHPLVAKSKGIHLKFQFGANFSFFP